MRLLLVLAFVLVATPPARAAFELPERSVVLASRAGADEAAAYARLGFRITRVPAAYERIDRRALAAMARSNVAVVVRPPLSSLELAALRAYAHAGGPRIVAHAEAGFRLADLAALAGIGPCLFELHLATDPTVFADGLQSLRPAETVWEAGTSPPSVDDLERFASMQRPFVAVDEASAADVASKLFALGDGRVGLMIRAKNGELSKPTWDALAAPERKFAVVVVAQDGLALPSARRLRALPNLTMELSLERAHELKPTLASAAVLSRAIDPPGEPALTDAEADALLMTPPPVDDAPPKRPLKVRRRVTKKR